MTEAERAHTLIFGDRLEPSDAARIMNAERKHGDKRVYSADAVRELAMSEQDRRMGRAPGERKPWAGAI